MLSSVFFKLFFAFLVGFVILLLLLLKSWTGSIWQRNWNWFPQRSLFLGCRFGKLFFFVFTYQQPFALWSQFSDGDKKSDWFSICSAFFLYEWEWWLPSFLHTRPETGSLILLFLCPSFLPSLPSYFFHLSSLPSSYVGPPPPSLPSARLCQSGQGEQLQCYLTIHFLWYFGGGGTHKFHAPSLGPWVWVLLFQSLPNSERPPFPELGCTSYFFGTY